MSPKLPSRTGAVALVVSLAAGLCVASPRPAAADDPRIEFERYRLPNGLEVILAPDRSVPLVAVSVWYHVGSGHETPGKSGFAHLFEHMLFQGSTHVGEDRHFETLKTIGGSSVNGTTNSDRTNYFEVVPSNQLETALWLESDRMAFMLPLLTQKSLDNQIEVVRNERRQRYDNVPYGAARFATAAALYPEGHPYRYMTIGRHEDLAAASLGDVAGFFKTWYVPANATLTLAGDFEVAEARRLVERWFGALPPSKRPAVVQVPPPAQRAERTVVDDMFARQRRISWIWHSPARYAPGDAELETLGSALSRDGTGRLYKTLVHERQLATNVSAYQSGSTFSGTFSVTVTLRGDADLAEVERLVVEELSRVRREQLAPAEVARVVTAYEASAIWRLESLLSRAEQLQSYNHYLDDPGRLSWDLDRHRAVTPAGVQAAASTYLDLARPVVIVTMPNATGRGPDKGADPLRPDDATDGGAP
jgi:predicted Zn-dependent peptidase